MLWRATTVLIIQILVVTSLGLFSLAQEISPGVDFYQVLGVAPSASQSTLYRNYKKKLAELGSTKKNKTQREQVQNAYDFLKNKENRAFYDRARAESYLEKIRAQRVKDQCQLLGCTPEELASKQQGPSENASQASPQGEPFTPSNMGFMAATVIQGMVNSAITGDPILQWAAWDSLHEVGGWVGLYAFAITSGVTQQKLGPHINSWWKRGPTDALGFRAAGQLGMFAGVITNHLVSKAWQSQSRMDAGVDMVEYGSCLFKSNHLRNRIVDVEDEIRKASSDEAKIKQLKWKKDRISSEYNVVRTQCAPFAWKVFNNLVGMVKEAYPDENDRKSLLDSAITMGITVSLINAVEPQVAKGWGASKRLLWRTWAIDKVSRELEKIPEDQRPKSLQFDFANNKNVAKNITALDKGALENIKIEAPGFGLVTLKTWLLSSPWCRIFAGSAANGVVFLLANQFVEHQYQPALGASLLHRHLENHLDEAEQWARLYVQQPNSQLDRIIRAIDRIPVSGNETLEHIAETMKDYSENWEEYRKSVILRDFNETQGAWTKSLTKERIRFFKLKNYVRWFALGIHSKEGRELFSDNGKSGNNIQWHVDTSNPSSFKKERDEYLAIYKSIGQKNDENINKMKFSDDPVEDRFSDLPPAVAQYLRDEEERTTNWERAFVLGQQRSLKDIIKKAFYSETPSWAYQIKRTVVMPEGNWVDGSAWESPFNMRKSYRMEVEHLRVHFETLYKKYFAGLYAVDPNPRGAVFMDMLFKAVTQVEAGPGQYEKLKFYLENMVKQVAQQMKSGSIPLGNQDQVGPLARASNIALLYAGAMKRAIDMDGQLEKNEKLILTENYVAKNDKPQDKDADKSKVKDGKPAAKPVEIVVPKDTGSGTEDLIEGSEDIL